MISIKLKDKVYILEWELFESDFNSLIGELKSLNLIPETKKNKKYRHLRDLLMELVGLDGSAKQSVFKALK